MGVEYAMEDGLFASRIVCDERRSDGAFGRLDQALCVCMCVCMCVHVPVYVCMCVCVCEVYGDPALLCICTTSCIDVAVGCVGACVGVVIEVYG